MKSLNSSLVDVQYLDLLPLHMLSELWDVQSHRKS